MVIVTGDRFLRMADVMAKTSLGRTKLRNLMGSGDFPQSFKVGYATLWRESAVDAWIAEVAETTDAAK